MTHRREGDVKTETEIGMMWPQAKGCQQTSKASRVKECKNPKGEK